jgi:GAF domain-containing protein
VSADEISRAASRLAGELGPDELHETLVGISRIAVETLPDVQEASISILRSDGRLETVAPTSAVLVELDSAQQDLGEGPCLQASEQGVHVVSADLRSDERFPSYGPVAVESGFLAQAGLNLFVREASRGALNLYSRRPGAFADVTSLAPLFAQQATQALAYAMEVGNLNRALQTRGTIGQAVGIVMERYRLDERLAFAFLTRLSQQRNVKLRDVAIEVNASATVPQDQQER